MTLHEEHLFLSITEIATVGCLLIRRGIEFEKKGLQLLQDRHQILIG